jgi:hypothetical protein
MLRSPKSSFTIIVRTCGTAFFRASSTATASPLRLDWLQAPNPTSSATIGGGYAYRARNPPPLTLVGIS